MTIKEPQWIKDLEEKTEKDQKGGSLDGKILNRSNPQIKAVLNGD